MDLDNEEIEATRNLKVNGDKEIKELRKKVKELEQEVEKYKKSLIKRIKYCNDLEKDLFENCENYVINKKKIKNKIEKLEELINEIVDDEEHSHKIPLYQHDIEILQELLQESEDK